MAKRPADSPTQTGQTVILRGRQVMGKIQKIDERGWVWVDWFIPKSGPEICHINELVLQP
jgi:hypothetical protein